MEHVNQVFQLFVGYSMFDKSRDEMKANCSVTLIKSESKNILVNKRLLHFKWTSVTVAALVCSINILTMLKPVAYELFITRNFSQIMLCFSESHHLYNLLS